jgi:hypothetical protein
MHTYAKIKDGRVMIVVGEGRGNGIEYMLLRPIGSKIGEDLEEVPHDQILKIDTNLAIL